jgi:hypothetical protein
VAHRRQPPLPESLDPPDIGFVAASGVYVAIALLMAFITIAVASGASAATIFGGITSTMTAGLIVGSLLASRLDGVPERLGRRWRSSAALFSVPLGFALLSIVSLLSPLSLATAAVAAFGSVLATVAAGGIASMARTRYARAMAPGEPIHTITRLNPNRGRWLLALGSLCLAGSGISVLTGHGAGLMLLLGGVYTLFLGISARSQGSRFSKDEQSETPTSRPRGRKVFGTRWGNDMFDNSEYLPELQIHENGIVTEQGNSRQFVPWSLVTDVRLTSEELVIERRRGFDLRCDRAVIENAEKAYEKIERTRGEWDETRAEDEAERTVSKSDLGRTAAETEIE